MEDYQGLLDDCSWLIEYQPNFLEAYKIRASMYEYLGNNEEALEDYNQILSLKPDFMEALPNRQSVDKTSFKFYL